VEFTNAYQDCLRRDFTVNGMFYDPLGRKIIDYVGARKDLKKRLIRTIGQPKQRFAEDYLRLLRAVRFAVKLDFKIEPSTWSAICSVSDKISQISAERICAELQAILTHPARGRGVRLLAQSGLAQAIFPGLEKSDLTPAIKALGKMRKDIDWPLALAGFWTGVSAEKALEWTTRLKPSRAQIKSLDFLMTNRRKLGQSELSLAELKMLLAEPYFWDLYELARAELKVRGKSMGRLLSLKKRALSIRGCRLRPKPLLNGHQLIAIGAAPGPMVGRLAREMYIAQLGEQIHTPAQAEKWVKDWLAKNAANKQ
jgi:tRNA nucleotidyltransferase/poly(A) polymerase